MSLDEVHKTVGIGREKFSIPYALKLRGVDMRISFEDELICTVLIFLSLLWSCSGSPQKVTPRDIQASPKETGHILPDAIKTFKTRTGKMIIVSEAHPMGQSLSNIEISTSGFEHNYPEMYEDRDPISNVFLADLDNNGFDEIYIITTSAGSGSYGNVLGFASNNDKSLSMINFPEMQNEVNFKGYRGHDTFTIKDHKLVRTFPIYNEGDTNLSPTKGTRKLVYSLYPGEAMWQLKIENSESQ